MVIMLANGLSPWSICWAHAAALSGDPNTRVASESSGAQRNKVRGVVASPYICPIPLHDEDISRPVRG